MKKDLLPIGSVVLLEGGTKTLMITGYRMSENAETGKIYDYVGCVFPEGFMEQIYTLFDVEQIKDVLFVGYMEEEAEKYLINVENGLTNAGIAPGPVQLMNGKKGRRKVNRRKPTNPLSTSEMRARYTKEVISGGADKVFDISDYK